MFSVNFGQFNVALTFPPDHLQSELSESSGFLFLAFQPLLESFFTFWEIKFVTDSEFPAKHFCYMNIVNCLM